MENSNTSTENQAKPGRSFKQKVKRIVIWCLILFILGYGTYYGITRFWPISKKQTAGRLQSFGEKGRIIVTYEGTILTQELMQDPESGISVKTLAFCVDKGAGQELRDFLQNNVGKDIKVWYSKYQQSFFWRGESVYVINKAELLNK